jgi:hypothetical protein
MKERANWIILASGIAVILLIFILDVPRKVVMPVFTLILLAILGHDIFMYSKYKSHEKMTSKTIIKDCVLVFFAIVVSILFFVKT